MNKLLLEQRLAGETHALRESLHERQKSESAELHQEVGRLRGEVEAAQDELREARLREMKARER